MIPLNVIFLPPDVPINSSNSASSPSPATISCNKFAVSLLDAAEYKKSIVPVAVTKLGTYCL